MKRRGFLAAAALYAKGHAWKLSIGNYGMQALEVDRALDLIREIGYQGAELCLMKDWPSEPVKLDAAARRRIREQPLPITSLLENFSLLDGNQAGILERIRRAAELAHDVAPQRPPVLQSVLGGKPEEWEAVKDTMAKRLAEWGRVAGENHLELAVKSHIGSASDTAEKLVWLLDRVKNPAVMGIYDYSHFQLMGLGLKQTLDTLLPRSKFITVKDGRLVDGKPRFLLPGEGTIDYQEYFELLERIGYKGWILVEVSRQLQVLSGYDPIEAAKKSYRQLTSLM